MIQTPAHVPPQLVFDFDYRRFSDGQGELFTQLKQALQNKPDVFWSPHHGGHWVITRGQLIREVLLNHRQFSSRYVSIPFPAGPGVLPTQADPPDHRYYRKIINELMNRELVEKTAAEVRQQTRQLIAELHRQGRCDFIQDFAQKIPLQAFLKMCQMQPEEHAVIFQLYERNGFKAFGEVVAHFSRLIPQRRADKKQDLVGYFVTAEVDGRTLGDEECLRLIMGLLLGL